MPHETGGQGALVLTLVLALSTALQYLAAGLALRLVLVTRRRAGWILIASAVLLMAVRRSLTLSRILLDEARPTQDLSTELVALLISVLMVAGISFIAPYFREIIEASARVEESERRLQAIIDNTTAVVYVKDLAGRFMLTNQKFERILDLEKGGAVGRSDQELFPPEFAQTQIENDRRVLESGEPIQIEENIVDSNGDEFTYVSLKFPLRRDDREIYATCTISTDISDRLRAEDERREFERRIQHTQKLESLGVLAGGIAHDFNNLLVPILATADQLSERAGPEALDAADLELIQSAAQRAAELCSQLLAYSGRGRFRVRLADLSRLVREMADMLQVSIQNAEVEYDLATDLPMVKADTTQLCQVVMNLVTNATEASGEKANLIRVSTGQEQVDGNTAERFLGGVNLPAGSYVYLEVSDHGMGMDEECLGRLFEPFYTTKFTGRGLGLAAVLGIVKGHGGTIRIVSTPGEGSTFRVLLPSSMELPERSAVSASSGPPTPAAGTVLVVDDDDSVRRVAVQVLESAGLKVLEAASGPRAIELYREHGDEIDTVLLDLTMPGMGGIEVMSAIREISPNARIVLMSGYDAAAALPADIDATDVGFLHKPFRSRQLRAMAIEKRETVIPEPELPKSERDA